MLHVTGGFAADPLITKLADVGLGMIADALRDASLPWVVAGLLLAQLTFVTSAISLRGAVLTRLPLLPCVGLASAVKFINLTVPSSAGRIAFTVRFLQKTGAPPGEAIAAGAVDKLSGTILELVLVLSLLPFVDLQIDTSGIGAVLESCRRGDRARAGRHRRCLCCSCLLCVRRSRRRCATGFESGRCE